jgi:Zn-dependent protease
LFKDVLEHPDVLLARLPVILLALTVHEFCHAYFALRMGDPTAYRLGRCTLNPLKHLDPLGTLCLLFAPIGWAKPVPINPLNFRDWKRGVIVSTAAGPLSNVVQAVGWALLIRGLHRFGGSISPPALYQAMWMMFVYGVIINVGLAVFNMLPLYPLDGFHITLALTRPEKQRKMAEMARYGPFAILGVILLSRLGKVDLLGRVTVPVMEWLLIHVSGLPLGADGSG